ncbi:MAG: hypothetical protein AB2A00_43100, partial [Myxococcota bacterium]
MLITLWLPLAMAPGTSPATTTPALQKPITPTWSIAPHHIPVDRLLSVLKPGYRYRIALAPRMTSQVAWRGVPRAVSEKLTQVLRNRAVVQELVVLAAGESEPDATLAARASSAGTHLLIVVTLQPSTVSPGPRVQFSVLDPQGRLLLTEISDRVVQWPPAGSSVPAPVAVSPPVAPAPAKPAPAATPPPA